MTSVHRFIYRAQMLPGHDGAAVEALNARASDARARVASGELMTASAYRYQSDVFVYYESLGAPRPPEAVFGDLSDVLAQWPGEAAPRCFVPMMDIFHCGEPLDAEYWRRKRPVELYDGKVIRLRPEKVASYIFYHYQLQEEQPGSFDKYCVIAIHENLMFFYMEKPFVLEAPPKPGALGTKNTPEQWQELMALHFAPWPDGTGPNNAWRDSQTLWHV